MDSKVSSVKEQIQKEKALNPCKHCDTGFGSFDFSLV